MSLCFLLRKFNRSYDASQKIARRQAISHVAKIHHVLGVVSWFSKWYWFLLNVSQPIRINYFTWKYNNIIICLHRKRRIYIIYLHTHPKMVSYLVLFPFETNLNFSRHQIRHSILSDYDYASLWNLRHEKKFTWFLRCVTRQLFRQFRADQFILK